MDDLLRRAKEGDGEAFEEVYYKYLPLMLRLKSFYYIRHYSSDDWKQEARIALYQALSTFDKAKKASFGSYYKRILGNRIYSILRKQNALKRRNQKEEISIEQKVSMEGSDFLAEDSFDEPLVLQRMILKEAVLNCPTRFSKLEMQILQRHLHGDTVEEIANHLQIEKNQVISAYSRVKTKLKNYLFSYRK